MAFDFSIFQNSENIIFFSVYFLAAVVAVAILAFISALTLRLTKVILRKVFPKSEDYKYAQNLEIAVPEAGKSKEEHKNSIHGPKMAYMNIEKPGEIEREKPDKSPNGHFDGLATISPKASLGGDIEEGLDALKKSAKNGEQEEQSVFSKIKIPKAKKVAPDRGSLGKDGGEDYLSGTETDEKETDTTEAEVKAEKKLNDYRFNAKNEDSLVQSDRLEMIKNSEIKMPQIKTAPAGLPENKESPEKDDKKDETFSSKPKITNDGSIFAGRSEVSRIDLRQKLRRDPKIWAAEKQVGLTLNPSERSKLEKEVFSQTYGRNISKTDLKWGIKKLNQKMLNTKNSAEKGKIRKEIKFFKKIGGVK